MTTNHTTERFNPCETEACKARCDRFGVACEDIAIDEVERLRAEIAELRAEREAMAKQEPGDADAFLIFYDDKDRAPEVFVGDGAKDAALRRYDAISTSWNAHLFWKIDSNSRDAWCASPVPIPEGWQLMDMGWLRQMMHVNFLKCHPDKSHEAIAYEIDRVLAAAPKHPTSTEGGA